VDVLFTTRFASGGARYGHRGSRAPAEIHHNPGCNALYRTSLLRAVGFEEFPTAEDVVVDHKLRTLGGRLLFDPEAIVRHKRRGSLRSLFRQLSRYGEGRALAARKYRRLWQPLYPLPSLGVVGFLLLAGASLAEALTGSPPRALLFLGGLSLAYVGVAAVDVALAPSEAWRARRALVALLLVPLAHVAWGLGYLRGALGDHPAFLARWQGLSRDAGVLVAGLLAGAALSMGLL
jgi:hypothetical protein